MTPWSSTLMCYQHHTYLEIANEMLSFGTSSIICCNSLENQVLGVITKTDLLEISVTKESFKGLKAEEIMVRDVVSVDEDDHRMIAAKKMVDHGIHHCVVINKEKKPVGVISTLDVLKSLVSERDDEIAKLLMNYSK